MKATAKRHVTVAEWEQLLATGGAPASAAAAAAAAAPVGAAAVVAASAAPSAGAEASKRHAHELVMEYLVREGYYDVAVAFAKESNTPLPATELPNERMAIRKAIQSGDIGRGIERINDLDPELLDRDGRLFYHLQQQKLLELVRTGDWAAALLFAQQTLSRRAADDADFLREMEKVMSLSLLPPAAVAAAAGACATATAATAPPSMARADTDPAVAVAAELLGPAHRQLMADEVNDALLAQRAPLLAASDSRLVGALRRLAFEQRRAPHTLQTVALPTIQPHHFLTGQLTPAAGASPPPPPPPAAASPAVPPPLPSPSPPLLPPGTAAALPMAAPPPRSAAAAAAAAAADAEAAAAAVARITSTLNRMDEKE